MPSAAVVIGALRVKDTKPNLWVLSGIALAMWFYSVLHKKWRQLFLGFDYSNYLGIHKIACLFCIQNIYMWLVKSNLNIISCMLQISCFTTGGKKLTLVLLTYPAFANSVDPDQLASEEANWSGSALFAIKFVNFYQQTGSSNLIGWKLEVGVES